MHGRCTECCGIMLTICICMSTRQCTPKFLIIYCHNCMLYQSSFKLMARSLASNVRAHLVKQVLLSTLPFPEDSFHLFGHCPNDNLFVLRNVVILSHVTGALLVNTRLQDISRGLQGHLGCSPPPSNAREWPLYSETCYLLRCSVLP